MRCIKVSHFLKLNTLNTFLFFAMHVVYKFAVPHIGTDLEYFERGGDTKNFVTG